MGQSVYLTCCLPLSPSPLTESPSPLSSPLTNRQLQILDQAVQLLTNKEIGAKLFISPGTVKTHLKNIYRKLGVNNRRQAVEKAKRLKII